MKKAKEEDKQKERNDNKAKYGKNGNECISNCANFLSVYYVPQPRIKGTFTPMQLTKKKNAILLYCIGTAVQRPEGHRGDRNMKEMNNVC